MKIKFNSEDVLPLNKTIEIPTMTIIVRAVFHENNKNSQQAFLDECLHKKKESKDEIRETDFKYRTCY